MQAAITHQDIVDRIEALCRERGAAYAAEVARIEKEKGSLQELCGGLGHVFRRTADIFSNHRACVFCSKVEAC